MPRKIHLGMMTQNELSDLIPNLEAALPHVDTATIIDGGSKDLTIPYMRNWSKHEPKLNYIVSPWEDDFPKQRNKYVLKIREFAEPGDWLVVMDPDEYYMPQTWDMLHRAIDRAERDGCNMIGLQCRAVTMDGPKRVWENVDEYWKELIIKWDPNFHYTGFKVHEGKGGIPHNILKTALIYEHRKQGDIIWIRGHRNLFTGGGGPNLGNRNPTWLELRKIATGLGLNSWHEYYDYLLKGNISQELKDLYINHRHEGRPNAGPKAQRNTDWDGASEMREMYKSYFRFLHPEEEPEEFRVEHID